MHENLCDKITEALSDDSFLPTLLINGVWGSGKTYFAKEILIERLIEEFDCGVHYLSLYGVSGIDDFRDKIMSLAYSSSDSAAGLLKSAMPLLDMVAQSKGVKGAGPVLSGLASICKQQLYAKISNCIFILDDLERVANSVLIKNIIGDIFDLADNKKIKFVVLSNDMAMPSDVISDIEKVFVNKLNFKSTRLAMVEVIKKEFGNDFEDEVYDIIISEISLLEMSNIRVLRRVAHKFSKIHEIVSELNDVPKIAAYKSILPELIRICYAIYEAGYSKQEIINVDAYGLNKAVKKVSKTSIETNERMDELEKIISGFVNIPLLDYCCNDKLGFDDIVSELSLPKNKSILECMLSDYLQYNLDESEFRNGVIALEKYINNINEEKDLSKAFQVINTYYTIIENGMYNKCSYTKESLLSLCRELDVDNFLPMHYNSYNEPYSFVTGFSNEEISDIYKIKRRELIDFMECKNDEKFVSDFIESWSKVSPELTRNGRVTPIFNILGCNNTIMALKNWTCLDVFEFSSFLCLRYRPDNIGSFLSVENESIRNIINELQLWIDKLTYDRKKALLYTIKCCLSDALTKME
ncbi:hypothetical protein [Plesiomonas shigelloides]|uniref:hypothetical protein n=1 Tax=Plesiomonas shigelloides TaxID=703 RepID=UPI003EB876C5